MSLQAEHIKNVFPSAMLVPSLAHPGCVLNVPAIFPAVYMGGTFQHNSNLWMLVLVLVLVMVDVGVGLQWGLGLWLMLELELRLG